LDGGEEVELFFFGGTEVAKLFDFRDDVDEKPTEFEANLNADDDMITSDFESDLSFLFFEFEEQININGLLEIGLSFSIFFDSIFVEFFSKIS